MKLIKYSLCTKVNTGTMEEPFYVDTLTPMAIECSTQAVFDANYPIVEIEAHPGSIEVTGKFDPVYPVAPHNIISGEYVTIGNVLYLATENIPNGEPIIVGQNAVVTTVEEQLYELTKGE